MPQDENGRRFPDSHTRKLFELSDDLTRRANDAIENMKARSACLNAVIDRSRDSDARISESHLPHKGAARRSLQTTPPHH